MKEETEPQSYDNEAKLAHYLDLLSDENPMNRWNGAVSLGRLGDPRAVDALIGALGDEDWRVRLKAIWALGAIGDPRGIPALKKLYRIENDDNRGMIDEAVEAINRAASGQ
jgi:HEAT repeat protein